MTTEPEPTTVDERKPATTYEITWMNGHVEQIQAHQVTWPGQFVNLFAGREVPRRVEFHADIDGAWTLQLSALMDDIRTIRNVATEDVIA